MPTVTLTARSVAALQTEQIQEEVYDAVVPGLAVRVGKGGTKTYIIRYRANGRHMRLTIGRHPQMTLAKARDQAREKLAAAQAGEDPAEERKLRRSKDTTFGALAAEVLANGQTRKGQPWREKTRREWTRIIDNELLPVWGKRPVSGIGRRDVVLLVDGIAQRAPVMANRVLMVVKVLFNKGLKRGFPTLEANPAHQLEPNQESGRSRYLSRDEIRVIWNATAFESPVAKAVIRLALLTAQRIGSVCSMRWADIDSADVWCIPAASFKGKRPHMVPLSAEALAVLEELRPLTGEGDYVFPGRGTGKHPYFAGNNKLLQRLQEATKLPGWTVHDFRTSFRTHSTRARKPQDKRDPAGLGIAPHIADAVLGHKEASLGFDRYTGEPERYLLSEKRDALKLWGTFVLAAVKRAGA